MQIQEKINKLKASIAKAEKEIQQLELITARFPDAYVSEDRWKTERIFSAAVTPLCDQFDWKHSCGCCADSPVQAWPYLDTAVGKIFAVGAPFNILARDEWGSGIYLRNGFDVTQTKLSPELQAKIQHHIDIFAQGDKPKDDWL